MPFFKKSGSPEDARQEDLLIYKVKWLVIFRIVLVTILLGSALIIQFKVNRSRPLDVLYIFIIFSYVFTAVTLYALKYISNIRLYAYFQIICDLCFETGIVYITGGVESPFTFTYIFTIITASILLFRRGAFIAASLSTIFYGVLVDLQFYRVLPLYSSFSFPFLLMNSSAIYYNIFLNFCAFYLVAFLSSYLSESLRRTHQRLQETSQDLTELQTFHQNILQSMHSGLLTTDLHGKITSYNRAAEQITGYTLSEIYGMDLKNIFPGISPPHSLSTISDTSKVPYRLETSIFTKTQLKVYVGVSISLLRDNTSKISGLICIFQDLTELRAMEEQIARADRLAAIGQLAAGMAHEIRNPLASISGSIQMLKADLILNQDDKVLMDIILRESTRLDSILTDFLTYARPKAITFVKCDLVHEILFPTIGLLKNDRRFPVENISVRVNAAPNFPKIVCDVQQMKQVFWNLFLNAFQAMPKGGILDIVAKIEKMEKQELDPHLPIYAGVISITDTGEGIDNEHLRCIFNPFYTTKKDGTGLGLAIVHSIIENHHGKIRMKSLVRQGTTFEVVLPLKQEHWS